MSASGGRSWWRSRASRLIAAAVVCAASFALSAGGLAVGALRGFRYQAADALFPSGPTDPRLTIVAIDSRSFAAVGEQWPWPRKLHAQLIDRLDDAGASQIVYDVLFAPPAPGDDALARAGRQADVVLAAVASELIRDADRPLIRAGDVTTPGAELVDATELGLANVFPDPVDGVVRAVPLVVESEDRELLPSLALQTLVGTEGLSGPFTFRRQGVVIGDRVIPTGPDGLMDIRFTSALHPESAQARVVSASDVLAGTDVPDLDGTIVLVGVTDPTLGDNRETPTAKAGGMPGVMVVANALNTMLTRNFLTRDGPTATAAWAGLLALVVALLTLLLPLWAAAPGSAALVVVYVLTAFVRFDTGTVMDLIYPPLLAALGFVACLGYRYLTEVRSRRRVSSLFSRYVPASVAEQLLEGDLVERSLVGERYDVTVFFCDLRGFTATSATLEPGQVRTLLDVYYEATVALILSAGGTLMQFVGDEVFAVFGAPIPDDDSASNAYRCAVAVEQSAGSINARLGDLDLPPIAYGIGLHTGPVVAAHVGPEARRQYAVIGDTVNCGARLCSIAGPGEIVVSDDTYRCLADPPDAELIPADLKGVDRDLLPRRVNVD